MKKYLKQITLIIIITIAVFTTSSKASKQELIQMAILLDTSSSMDGLINQAKSQLWKIVNEFALAKKNGKCPKLEVALYEYGKSSIPANEGYMRMILPLTTDLDSISNELFKLTTNGGDEYCGRVIDTALKGLKWSKCNDNMRVVVIAGNEPFTQGVVDYRNSCKRATSKGIILNTIFCGNYDEGIRTKWKHGADLAEGKYMNIDHNQKIVHIKAPQDDEIVRLGRQLNKTYIAYGARGKAKKEMQSAQDRNAAAMGTGSVVQRSIAKASKQYNNAGWDLLDAVESESVDLDELEEDDLPAEMRKMDRVERKEHLEKMLRKRAKLQKKINKLNKDRRDYVMKERKKKAAENTLDAVIIKTIRAQASDKNFNFE